MTRAIPSLPTLKELFGAQNFHLPPFILDRVNGHDLRRWYVELTDRELWELRNTLTYKR